MTYIFRVKTIYHLLQALLIVKNHDVNESILIIDDVSLVDISSRIDGSNVFGQVLNNSILPEHAYLRLFYIFYNVVKFRFLNILSPKEYKFFTPIHNVSGVALNFYSRAKEVVIFDDGNYSYLEIINGRKNELYTAFSSESILKRFFSSYFLSIYRNKNDKYIYTNTQRFMNSLPEYYNLIRGRVLSLNLDREMECLDRSARLSIMEIFAIDFELPESNDSVIILTQPLVESKELEKERYLSIIECAIRKYKSRGYEVYFKQHPRECGQNYEDIISKYDVIEIPVLLPFEILKLLGVKFDVGASYSSTALQSSIISNVEFLSENITE
ncbi:polysialyltransferase family glycosyltransferase [Vibrio splendidus]